MTRLAVFFGRRRSARRRQDSSNGFAVTEESVKMAAGLAAIITAEPSQLDSDAMSKALGLVKVLRPLANSFREKDPFPALPTDIATSLAATLTNLGQASLKNDDVS